MYVFISVISKAWFLLRKYILTIPRFDLFLQGALLIVVFLESYVFLLLRRNAGSGYLRSINEGKEPQIILFEIVYLNITFMYNIIFRMQSVSRTLQGKQRESSVKTLRSPLSAEFWRHYVLSGRTQRRTLPRHQSEEMEI